MVQGVLRCEWLGSGIRWGVTKCLKMGVSCIEGSFGMCLIQTFVQMKMEGVNWW